jgi:hypothetical protein
LDEFFCTIFMSGIVFFSFFPKKSRLAVSTFQAYVQFSMSESGPRSLCPCRFSNCHVQIQIHKSMSHVYTSCTCPVSISMFKLMSCVSFPGTTGKCPNIRPILPNKLAVSPPLVWFSWNMFPALVQDGCYITAARSW